MLKIATNLALPTDVITQVEVILAKRRAGKSYTMRRLGEQLLDALAQVVIVDPKGDQWGIRSSADGKRPGYPVLILGGEHGDLPLEASAGELIAHLVVEQTVNVLLDLSQFRKHEVATFMTAFMENLYRLKAQEKYRTPMKLIVDEADAIAPQRPQKGEERMLGAIEDIVRRGGQRGIGCTLVSQRSAVLNKNVLTQAQILIVLRTIAPQDIAAMKAWIEVHGTLEQGKELIDSLPSLPIGDAWFWSPGWPTEEGIFKRVHVLPIETFDSGATPKAGSKPIVPKQLAEVDLDALKGQMAATIEKKKADDPKLLRAHIKKLEQLLTAKNGSFVTKEVAKVEYKKVEVAVLKDAQIKRLESLFGKISLEESRYSEKMAQMTGNFSELTKEILGEIRRIPINPTSAGVSPARTPQTPSAPSPRYKEPIDALPADDSNISGPVKLNKCARSILSYLHSAHPNGKSKAQLWVATGYMPGGGFDGAIYQLTGAGLIGKNDRGLYTISEPVDLSLIDQSFDASLIKWDSKLNKCARSIFHLLLQNPQTALSKPELAQQTGYALGGGFDGGIYSLTGKELVLKESIGYKINPLILDL